MALVSVLSAELCTAMGRPPAPENNVMRSMWAIILLALHLGCTSATMILTGEKRPAISPGQVKVYSDPPKKFETIGLIEAKSEIEFSGQAAVDRALMRLREEAAEVGANGVLLTSTGERSEGFHGTMVGNVFVGGSSQYKTIAGKAIYVEEE